MQQEWETVAVLKSTKQRERERNRAAETTRDALHQRGSTGWVVVS